MLHAEELYRQKQKKETVEAAAKEATETAEEARVMAVKQKAEEEAQAAAAAREAKARADAAAEAKRRAMPRARSREQARQAEQARAAGRTSQSRSGTHEAGSSGCRPGSRAPERRSRESEGRSHRSATGSRRRDRQGQAAAAVRAICASGALRQQAEKEKQELRARLLQQLNSILATRDSARGLIANMSDVLFRSGSFELLPGARERLAKVSGIVLAYPSLHLSVEGHTDSVGSDDYNQNSPSTAPKPSAITLCSREFRRARSKPTASARPSPSPRNDTPEGRQQNRRVELVLSGDAIGNNFDAPSSTRPHQPPHPAPVRTRVGAAAIASGPRDVGSESSLPLSVEPERDVPRLRRISRSATLSWTHSRRNSMPQDPTPSLRQHLVELLTGGDAHAKFEDAIKDLPPKLRGAKPQNFPHSPWMLLEHLRIAQWDILEFSRNKKHESPKWPEGYWPKTRSRHDRSRLDEKHQAISVAI